MFALAKKHVIITGAGGGIGRALVAAFRNAGATVSACDLDAGQMQDLDAAHRAVFDLKDARGTRAALTALFEAAGAPDILVNNAGGTVRESMRTLDQEGWEDDIDFNLTGAFNVTTPVLERMLQRGAGSIVFISSVNALQHFGNPAYSAAKAGMLAYCRAIAVEHGTRGIRANAVCPGSVMTAAWGHRLARDPGIRERLTNLYALGRLVEPAEVANAALFLASPLSSGVTGAVLPVDAGLTAGHPAFIRDILGEAL